MMTARHLVRLLLELRRFKARSPQVFFDHANNVSGQSQPGSGSGLGGALGQPVIEQRGYAKGQPSIGEQANIGQNITNGDLDQKGIGNSNVLGLNAYGDLAGQSGSIFGQSGLPQQKFDLGQQGSLLSQSSGTVSGFWVPFKRRAA